MCGLAGFLDATPQRSQAELHAVAARMAATLHHRGPDDAGVWADAQSGYAVGFQRLAIVDLSPHGRQPMPSANDRYVIAFNGEIYNHAQLRNELLPSITGFRGHSDTEVLLAGITQWGLREALQKSVGMFALALWDRRERTLYLARDRIGEKPLYYGWMGSTFLFGSELKALRQHPQFCGEINRDALIPYLRHSYIPSPWSIYKNIRKLLPGTFLAISSGTNGKPQAPVSYWSAREAAETGIRKRQNLSASEAADELENVLSKTIGEQMIADVPLGAFLSGGVDSSAIVALMQRQTTRPVKTFTIGFDDPKFNEAEFAKAVARHLGTEHTELYVSPQDALDVIPRLPFLYDEPFADSSQIPTHLVAQMARQHVTVSLSGDGGDEIFAGYKWYVRNENMWRRLRSLPASLRLLTSDAMNSLSVQTWDKFAGATQKALPCTMTNRVRGNLIHKLSAILRNKQVEELHRSLISYSWHFGENPVLGAVEPLSCLNDPRQWARAGGPIDKLQCFDMQTYLPDDIMVKVDRATMGVSLESRAPFLDHRVVEFAWRLPLQFKIHQGKSKWLLKQVLYKYVPEKLIERPKGGFTAPLGSWLRGPLKDWAEALLDEAALREQGIFSADVIRKLWTEHQSGERNWDQHLWNVLMFQAWYAND